MKCSAKPHINYLFSIGRGGANHKASIRLFDAPDGYEPEVTLYRDTAGWYVN